MLKKLCLLLFLINISNNSLCGDSEEIDFLFDEFCVEDENLVGCICCRHLACFIFLEEQELYGLCIKCYLGG